jgi:secreted PhoX family phosphatase
LVPAYQLPQGLAVADGATIPPDEDTHRTAEWFSTPDAIAIAPDGRLLIAEYDGARIEAVTP